MQKVKRQVNELIFVLFLCLSIKANANEPMFLPELDNIDTTSFFTKSKMTINIQKAALNQSTVKEKLSVYRKNANKAIYYSIPEPIRQISEKNKKLIMGSLFIVSVVKDKKIQTKFEIPSFKNSSYYLKMSALSFEIETEFKF